jgi:hypothetical protein
MFFDVHPARDRKVLRRSIVTKCQAVADRGFRFLGDTLRDVSPDGAFLETEVDVAVGDEVYVSFEAPRSRIWIDACARVVRVVRGRRTADRGRGVGLSFVEIAAIDQAILEGSLDLVPPPVPARAARVDYAGVVRAIAGV